MPNSIRAKFVQAISYTALASIVVRLCGIILSILIARILKSSSLGLFTILQSTIGLYATFICSALSLAATKMIAQYYINDPNKAGRIIALLVVSLSLALVSGVAIYWFTLPLLANKIYQINELMLLLQVSTIWLVFFSINLLLESVLMGLQSFKQIMIIQSVYSVLNIPLVCVALIFGNAKIVLGLVFAGTLTSTIQFFLLLLVTFAEMKKYLIVVSFQNLQGLIKEVLFEFSFPAFLGKIFEQPLSWISIFLLVKLSGDLSSVGGLTVISNVRTWILYFPILFSSVMLPIFTDIFHTRSKESFQKTLIFNQRFLWLSTLPILVFMIIVIHPLINKIFGASYENYWRACAVLLAASVLIPINEVNDKALISMNKMWTSLAFRTIYMVLFVLGLLYFVPRNGLLGYVIAWNISYFVYVMLQTIWLRSVIYEPSVYALTFFSIIFLLTAMYIPRFIFSANLLFILGFTLFIIVLLIEWFLIITAEEKLIICNELKILTKLR